MEAIDIVEIVMNLSLIVGVLYINAKLIKVEKEKQQNQ